MRRVLGVAGLAVVVLTPAVAQSSQFGVRGLGLPGRELSTHSLALGGATGVLDGESSLNPAALGTIVAATALFTTSGGWRNSTNPTGSASTRDTRFPQIVIGGPIPHRPFAVGVSYSLYTDRDFTVASNGTASPRGVPIAVHDTFSSRGGIDDLRLALAWVAGPRFALGGGLHFLTGSNRLSSRRFWEDSTYVSPPQTAELSYSALGLSIGAIWQPVKRVELGVSLRHDGAMKIRRDSTGSGLVQFATTTIGTVSLPTTISAAARYSVSPRLAFVSSVTRRNWSVADSSLVAQGAPGARNTLEINAGLELLRDAKHPSRYPLRLGARSATLPFLLAGAPQPKEYGISVGTGFRFAQDRGGFDIAVEHVWRSQGSQYRESATLVTFGVSVRPGGLRP